MNEKTETQQNTNTRALRLRAASYVKDVIPPIREKMGPPLKDFSDMWLMRDYMINTNTLVYVAFRARMAASSIVTGFNAVPDAEAQAMNPTSPSPENTIPLPVEPEDELVA